MRINSRLYHQCGFGLVDVITFIILASVLCLLSMPALTSMNAEQALKLESKLFKTTLERLVIDAALYEQDIELLLDTHSYAAHGKEPPHTLLVKHKLRSPVKIATGNIDKRISIFHGKTASPASVELNAGQKSCTIVISLRGRVRMECG